MLKCAIYARVSTEAQKTDMQLTELRDYAQRQGWTSALTALGLGGRSETSGISETAFGNLAHSHVEYKNSAGPAACSTGSRG